VSADETRPSEDLADPATSENLATGVTETQPHAPLNQDIKMGGRFSGPKNDIALDAGRSRGNGHEVLDKVVVQTVKKVRLLDDHAAPPMETVFRSPAKDL
jgi:hypothetical protein